MSRDSTCIFVDFKNLQITINQSVYQLEKLSDAKYSYVLNQEKFLVKMVNHRRLELSNKTKSDDIKAEVYLKTKARK
jgi:hypothetical protein